MLRGAVFDLDDTLYLEHDYVLSAFHSVAEKISLTTQIDQVTIVDELLAIHNGGHRGRVFDAWLTDRPLLQTQLNVASLVESYRIHEPRISLIPDVARMLETLREAGLKLGLVTDGYVKSQRAKVKALGLTELLDRIVFTDEWGRDFWKPNTRAFELLEAEWQCNPREVVYIADNPAKDFIGPKARGWQTIQVSFAGQIRHAAKAIDAAASPDHEVASIESLLKLLVEHAHGQLGAQAF